LAAAYLPAQVAGRIGGAVVANLMFSKAAVSSSNHDRTSGAHFLPEVVATLGLMIALTENLPDLLIKIFQS
jgi:arsenate reductase